MNKNRETKFKVSLSNGVKVISWSRLNNLTEYEKDYLFKNAKHCASFNGDLSNFCTDKITKMIIK